MPRTSVAQMKERGTCPLQREPRPGTQIRAIYDWWLDRPMKVVHTMEILKAGNMTKVNRNATYIIDYLRDYGLNIISLGPKQGYILVSDEHNDFLLIRELINDIKKKEGVL